MGTGNETGISEQSAKKTVDEFMQSFNGNIPLKIQIADTQESVYGDQGSKENVGTIKGAYHAERGTLVFIRGNAHSVSDARQTLRPEVLGHYGINTFKPADKKVILDKIIASKNHPSLKAEGQDHGKVKCSEVHCYLSFYWHGLGLR